MKIGDMIRHYDVDCGTGLIVETPKFPVGEYQDPPDVLVLWEDGELEYCDPLVLELAE